MSVNSWRATSRYLLPSTKRFSAESISLGMSILRELGGSSPYRSLDFCMAVCPFAREKPVDKHARRVGMGGALDQADRTAASAQRLPFFPVPGFKILHRQSLT